MKILVKNVLMLGILGFIGIITGCGKNVETQTPRVITVTEYKVLAICDRPPVLKLASFKNDLHVGHIENQKIQDYNDVITEKYILGLHNTILCYESQTLHKQKTINK